MRVGELERLLAGIYPLRIPIAIGSIVLLVVLAIVARRRGWDRAARRHPRVTAAVVAIALLVGLPLAWYFVSPLFVRTRLDEPAPVMAAGGGPSPTATASAAGPSASADPGTTPANGATPGTGGTSRAGTFVGADDFHFGSGRVYLMETAPGTYTLRFEDFSVRNGPDLYVYLSPDPNGYAAGVLEVGRLKATDGSFNYELPPGTDVSGFQSVVIWCRPFSVQFASARLTDT